jgi:hypothetical protein
LTDKDDAGSSPEIIAKLRAEFDVITKPPTGNGKKRKGDTGKEEEGVEEEPETSQPKGKVSARASQEETKLLDDVNSRTKDIVEATKHLTEVDAEEMAKYIEEKASVVVMDTEGMIVSDMDSLRDCLEACANAEQTLGELGEQPVQGRDLNETYGVLDNCMGKFNMAIDRVVTLGKEWLPLPLLRVFDEYRKWWLPVFDDIKNYIKNMWRRVVSVVRFLWDETIGATTHAIHNFGQSIQRLYAAIQNNIGMYFDMFENFVLGMIKQWIAGKQGTPAPVMTQTDIIPKVLLDRFKAIVPAEQPIEQSVEMQVVDKPLTGNGAKPTRMGGEVDEWLKTAIMVLFKIVGFSASLGAHIPALLRGTIEQVLTISGVVLVKFYDGLTDLLNVLRDQASISSGKVTLTKVLHAIVFSIELVGYAIFSIIKVIVGSVCALIIKVIKFVPRLLAKMISKFVAWVIDAISSREGSRGLNDTIEESVVNLVHEAESLVAHPPQNPTPVEVVTLKEIELNVKKLQEKRDEHIKELAEAEETAAYSKAMFPLGDVFKSLRGATSATGIGLYCFFGGELTTPEREELFDGFKNSLDYLQSKYLSPRGLETGEWTRTACLMPDTTSNLANQLELYKSGGKLLEHPGSEARQLATASNRLQKFVSTVAIINVTTGVFSTVLVLGGSIWSTLKEHVVNPIKDMTAKMFREFVKQLQPNSPTSDVMVKFFAGTLYLAMAENGVDGTLNGVSGNKTPEDALKMLQSMDTEQVVIVNTQNQTTSLNIWNVVEKLLQKKEVKFNKDESVEVDNKRFALAYLIHDPFASKSSQRLSPRDQALQDVNSGIELMKSGRGAMPEMIDLLKQSGISMVANTKATFDKAVSHLPQSLIQAFSTKTVGVRYQIDANKSPVPMELSATPIKWNPNSSALITGLADSVASIVTRKLFSMFLQSSIQQGITAALASFLGVTDLTIVALTATIQILAEFGDPNSKINRAHARFTAAEQQAKGDEAIIQNEKYVFMSQLTSAAMDVIALSAGVSMLVPDGLFPSILAPFQSTLSDLTYVKTEALVAQLVAQSITSGWFNIGGTLGLSGYYADSGYPQVPMFDKRHKGLDVHSGTVASTLTQMKKLSETPFTFKGVITDFWQGRI